MREPRHISSRAHALVKTLHRLATEPAASRRLGQVWLEGDHLARAFLARGGRAALAVVGASAWLQPGPRELALQAAEIVVIDDALLPEISSLESPAPIGFLIDLPSSGQQPLPGVATVVLDRLQDPGNVGTILRSAAALGVRQVLAMKGSAALWSPKVLRAGMGAHFAVALHTDAELTRVLAEFNGPAIVTSLDATQSLYALDLRQPCAFVFGNEGAGVSAPVLARASHPVRIPMPGVAESLNVAAAVAVCLFEQVRQRLPG